MSLFVWLALEKRDDLKNAFKASGLYALATRTPKIPRNTQPTYNSVPVWWYWVAALVSVVLGIVACEAWPVQLHWYGVLLSFAVAAFFFVPVVYPATLKTIK